MLVLPPEVKLTDKLADRAVHDYRQVVSQEGNRVVAFDRRTFNTAKARPSIDLGRESVLVDWAQRYEVPEQARQGTRLRMSTYSMEKLRLSSGLWPMDANWASSRDMSFILS